MNKAERIAAASLSRTSKLGCFSWSLQALETCPGSIGAAACSGCYATGGFYAMPDAKAVEAMMKYNKSLQKAGAIPFDNMMELQTILNETYKIAA